jgi:CBS domain-containing protein
VFSRWQETQAKSGDIMGGKEHPRQSLQAAAIMSHNPIVIDGSATVQDAADAMFTAEVRHVLVVEQGELIGMVSDRDLRSYVLPHSEQMIRADEARARLGVSVRTVMRQGLITVTPDTPVADIIDIMLRENIGAVPVLRPASRQLLGLVSYVDVLRAARALL